MILDIRKNKNKNIIKVSEIKDFLSALPKNNTLILKNEHHFICGVYYKNDDWRFMFNDFTIFSLDGKNQYGLVGEWDRHLESMSDDGKLYYLMFDNIENMCYEIRQEILKDCFHTLMNPKFMIGDKEYESNLPKIIPEVQKDLGHVVIMDGNEEGILVGLSSTLEDYYHVYITQDGKLRFSSCVGGYKPSGNIQKEFVHLIENPSEISKILCTHFNDPMCTEILVVSI